jgi:uncharacterized protein (DUF488 family)
MHARYLKTGSSTMFYSTTETPPELPATTGTVHRSKAIYTIGYEGRTIDAFIQLLERSRVRHLMDVRAVPLSRKKGFSKSALAEALTSAGIRYTHVRSAGNPFRDEKDNPRECIAKFRRHLDSQPAIVSELVEKMDGDRVALMCFEADPATCHRSVVAEKLVAVGVASVVRNI